VPIKVFGARLRENEPRRTTKEGIVGKSQERRPKEKELKIAITGDRVGNPKEKIRSNDPGPTLMSDAAWKKKKWERGDPGTDKKKCWQ